MTSKAAKRARRAASREANGTKGRWKSSRRQFAQVVVASGCLLAMGVTLCVQAVVMFAGAAGLIGTPGRLYVDQCAVMSESNHPVTWCTGILRDTADQLVDTNASIAVSARVGSTIAVRDIPGTGLETVGFRAVEGWATAFFAGLLCVELGLLIGWARWRQHAARRAGREAPSPSKTPSRRKTRVVVFLLLSPGAGAAAGAVGYAVIAMVQAIAAS